MAKDICYWWTFQTRQALLVLPAANNWYWSIDRSIHKHADKQEHSTDLTENQGNSSTGCCVSCAQHRTFFLFVVRKHLSAINIARRLVAIYQPGSDNATIPESFHKSYCQLEKRSMKLVCHSIANIQALEVKLSITSASPLILRPSRTWPVSLIVR